VTTVRLAGDALEVALRPDRGAEISSLVHRPTGTELLFRAPWGARDGAGFLDRYEGGWQELFPSVGDETTYRGRTIPFHGEVAILPWECVAAGDELRCSVDCRATPLRLERTMRLVDSSLVLDEEVTNVGDADAHFVWGHHVVLGPPFVEAGCRLELPARTIVTIPEMWEDTARLEPGQREPWPFARLRGGGTVDLRDVPGTEPASHDDVYLTDLEGGWAEVRNPRLGLAFRLEFEDALFRWIVSWQPYGGAQAAPLAGAYALGVEPWTSRLPLGEAVTAGEARRLGPGESVRTAVVARVTTEDEWHR
jgi:galactose mutarotase-like enzyme